MTVAGEVDVSEDTKVGWIRTVAEATKALEYNFTPEFDKPESI